MSLSVCIRHARKHFSQAEGGQLDEVRQVMGMLAFPSDTHISPYKVTLVVFISVNVYKDIIWFDQKSLHSNSLCFGSIKISQIFSQADNSDLVIFVLFLCSNIDNLRFLKKTDMFRNAMLKISCSVLRRKKNTWENFEKNFKLHGSVLVEILVPLWAELWPNQPDFLCVWSKEKAL